MKGRARRDKANFFVFQNREEDEKSLTLSLADAQDMEHRVRCFLSSHMRTLKHFPPLATQSSWLDKLDSENLGEEGLAVKQGFYAAA